jgi:hypothetical protein
MSRSSAELRILVASINWECRHNRLHGHTNDSSADPDLLPSLLDRLLGSLVLVAARPQVATSERAQTRRA